jgi:hypothetical protein
MASMTPDERETFLRMLLFKLNVNGMGTAISDGLS